MTYPTDILFPIRRVRGFSLIELMIVVAIVAILASVAYPSYRDSVLKGRRGEARAALAELMQEQERYMTQHNKYLTFSAGATGTPFKTTAGDSNSPSYKLSAVNCKDSAGTEISDKVCIQIVAEPTGTDPKVGNLEMASTGVKTCTGTSKDATTKTSALCWP